MGRPAAQLGRGVRRLCCRHLGRWPDSSWRRQLAVVTARSRSLLEVDAHAVQCSFDVGHRRRWWRREEGRPQSAEDLWQRDGRGPGFFPRAGVVEAKAIGEPGDLADEVVSMRLPVPGVESKTVSCSCYLVMCLHRGRLGQEHSPELRRVMAVQFLCAQCVVPSLWRCIAAAWWGSGVVSANSFHAAPVGVAIFAPVAWLIVVAVVVVVVVVPAPERPDKVALARLSSRPVLDAGPVLLASMSSTLASAIGSVVFSSCAAPGANGTIGAAPSSSLIFGPPVTVVVVAPEFGFPWRSREPSREARPCIRWSTIDEAISPFIPAPDRGDVLWVVDSLLEVARSRRVVLQ